MEMLTIIGKNWAWIQRKIVARVRSKGPVKKKIPLKERQYEIGRRSCVAERSGTYTTA
jgi:hypothetical protein